MERRDFLKFAGAAAVLPLLGSSDMIEEGLAEAGAAKKVASSPLWKEGDPITVERLNAMSSHTHSGPSHYHGNDSEWEDATAHVHVNASDSLQVDFTAGELTSGEYRIQRRIT